MNRKLAKNRNIIRYLERNYGKAYKFSFQKQQVFKDSLNKDHSHEELKLMYNELVYRRDLASDLNFLETIPYTFFLALLTSLLSFLSSFLGILYGVMSNVFLKIWDQKEITTKDIMDIFFPDFIINFVTNFYIFIIIASLGLMLVLLLQTSKNRRKVHFYIKLISDCVKD